MSELPPGSVNIEDDTPPLAPDAAVTPPPAAAAPPEVPPESRPAEVESVEVGGEKYVPVGALISERKQRQSLSEKANLADQLAQQNQQLQQQLNENAPLVSFLKNNPQLLQPRQAEPVSAAPVADPDALEAAQLMDFYKADGTPDVDKGARWLALQDRRSGKVASQAIQPYAQQTARERADANFQKAMRVKDAEGNTPSVESLRSVWGMMQPEDLADERVAGVMAAMALGVDRFKPKPPAPPPNEPLVSEAAGGSPRTRVQMSAIETRVAQQKGIAPTQWAENIKNHQPGRPTVLED